MSSAAASNRNDGPYALPLPPSLAGARRRYRGTGEPDAGGRQPVDWLWE